MSLGFNNPSSEIDENSSNSLSPLASGASSRSTSVPGSEKSSPSKKLLMARKDGSPFKEIHQLTARLASLLEAQSNNEALTKDKRKVRKKLFGDDSTESSYKKALKCLNNDNLVDYLNHLVASIECDGLDFSDELHKFFEMLSKKNSLGLTKGEVELLDSIKKNRSVVKYWIFNLIKEPVHQRKKLYDALLIKEYKISHGGDVEPIKIEKPKLQATSSISSNLNPSLAQSFNIGDIQNIKRLLINKEQGHINTDSTSARTIYVIRLEEIVKTFLNNPTRVKFYFSDPKKEFLCQIDQWHLSISELLMKVTWDNLSLTELDEVRYIKLLQIPFQTKKGTMVNSLASDIVEQITTEEEEKPLVKTPQAPFAPKPQMKDVAGFPTKEYFNQQIAKYQQAGIDLSAETKLSHAEQLAFNIHSGDDAAVINGILTDSYDDVLVELELKYKHYLRINELNDTPDEKDIFMSHSFGYYLTTLCVMMYGYNQTISKTAHQEECCLRGEGSLPILERKKRVHGAKDDKYTGYLEAFVSAYPSKLGSQGFTETCTIFIGTDNLTVGPFSQHQDWPNALQNGTYEKLIKPTQFKTIGYVQKNQLQYFALVKSKESDALGADQRIPYKGKIGLVFAEESNPKLVGLKLTHQ